MPSALPVVTLDVQDFDNSRPYRRYIGPKIPTDCAFTIDIAEGLGRVEFPHAVQIRGDLIVREGTHFMCKERVKANEIVSFESFRAGRIDASLVQVAGNRQSADYYPRNLTVTSHVDAPKIIVDGVVALSGVLVAQNLRAAGLVHGQEPSVENGLRLNTPPQVMHEAITSETLADSNPDSYESFALGAWNVPPPMNDAQARSAHRVA